MVTALLAVVTLVLIGFFWRQVITGVGVAMAGMVIIGLIGLLAWGAWSLWQVARESLTARTYSHAQEELAAPAVTSSQVSAGIGIQNDTGGLTVVQRTAIGAYVRRCWPSAAGALRDNGMQVVLIVTTDVRGVARIIHFSPADRARMVADPVFRRFAERARRAVFDPRCVKLPLPSDMLGKINVLDFRFSP